MVIQTIFDNPDYLWSSNEINQAWGKSRSGKDNEKSDHFREQGNEHVKSGNGLSVMKQLMLHSNGFLICYCSTNLDYYSICHKKGPIV